MPQTSQRTERMRTALLRMRSPTVPLFGEACGLPTYFLDTVFAPRGETSSTRVLTTEPNHGVGIAGGIGNTVVIRN